jgi:four helix bundle protein
VGSNYIEANECLSKKDFIYRIKICLKEAKESRYWLKLIKNTCVISDIDKLNLLISESTELIRIFASIINKFGKENNN